MGTKPIKSACFILLLTLLLSMGASWPLPAAESTPLPTDILVKISRPDKILDLLENFAAKESEKPIKSPVLKLRELLQGTDWIDPERSIVIGIDLTKARPYGVMVVPFRQPNVKFQETFKASAGPDFYILVPPGQNPPPADAVPALDAVSRVKATSLLSADFAVRRILGSRKEDIQKQLNNLERLPGQQDPAPAGISAQDSKNLLINMLNAAEQVETLSVGLNVDAAFLSTFLEARASEGSKLAKLFRVERNSALLETYQPNLQFNFRSHRYNVKDLFEFMNSIFGALYAKMGIDFPSFFPLIENFTGEMAGGISYRRDGARLEIISVLKDARKADDFLEKVYLPRMEKYSRDLAAFLEKQPGQKAKQLFVRTPDSTVAGYKVVGIRTRFSLPPATRDIAKMPNLQALTSYESRLTTMGNLLLIAPDDKRLKEMISIANGFKAKRAQGPLMFISIDMTGYFSAIASMVPGLKAGSHPLPKMAKATIAIDLKNGTASATSRIKIDDIKKMAAYFKKMSLREAKKRPAKTPPKVPVPPAQDARKDFAYWYNRGVLCSTYGNDTAAIKYFKKALSLDPRKSEAYFQMGVSYGEISDFEQAMSAINKALSIDAQNGGYYYGRGRTYLLFGQREKALEDFNRAAALGSRDAQNYLSRTPLSP